MTREQILANPEYKALKRAVNAAMCESDRGNYAALDVATFNLDSWLKAQRKAAALK